MLAGAVDDYGPGRRRQAFSDFGDFAVRNKHVGLFKFALWSRSPNRGALDENVLGSIRWLGKGVGAARKGKGLFIRRCFLGRVFFRGLIFLGGFNKVRGPSEGAPIRERCISKQPAFLHSCGHTHHPWDSQAVAGKGERDTLVFQRDTFEFDFSFAVSDRTA